MSEPTAPSASTSTSTSTSTAGIRHDGDASRPPPEAIKAPRPLPRPRAAPPSAKNEARREETPDEIVARLLTRVAMPPAQLDRRHAPGELLGALDRAGLGSNDALPAGLFCALALMSAAAGPRVTLEPSYKLGSPTTNAAIRVCLVTEDRSVPLAPPDIMAAAYGLQNDLLDRYMAAAAVEGSPLKALDRRALHALATRAALELGTALPPPLPDTDRDRATARPQVVVDDGALRAVIDASAGGTGVLLVDERRMANFARVACGDPATAAALNTAALGQPLAAPDRTSGRVTLRRLPVAVIGVLTLAECEGLYTARAEELVGTVFVQARPHACDGDGTALLALVRRVHELGAGNGIKLHLHEAATAALGEAAERWKKGVDQRLEPIATYISLLKDLARRIAAALHMVDAAAKMKLSAEITAVTMRATIGIIDDLVVPGARQVLGPVSAPSPEEADALRVIAALRRHTSAADPAIEKRELSRRLQNAVPSSPRFKAATRMLEHLKLISPAPPPEGQKGEHLKSETALHI